MTFATIGNVRVHYELTGSSGESCEGEALPVLVLSHSLGVDLSMWQPQLDALAGRFRILRYDTRGHGASSIPDGPYSVSDLGNDVIELMDLLEIERFGFCGLSMGGIIGQWLGIHASARLEKLVLANTAAKIGTSKTWDDRIDLVNREGLAPIIPGTLERWLTPGFRVSHPGLVRSTESLLGSADPSGYVACCAAIRDADFRAEIAGIRVPTLVIGGTHDPVTPLRDAEFLAGNIPGASLLKLHAAHLSSIEASDEFNRSLLEFLSS